MYVGCRTDKGIRRDRNEDSLYILQQHNVYIVADGVGGENAGEVASRTAVSCVAKAIEENPVKPGEDKYQIIRHIQDGVDLANREIMNISRFSQEKRGMATTLVILYSVGDTAFICNVGDSRVYLYRGKKLRQLTEDHTYVNSLVKAGVISAEEAETDSRRNMITKALGADFKIKPDYYKLKIKKGDIFLMCTDGMYNELSEAEIVEALESSEDMTDICMELVNRSNNNGGRDNITVICLKVSEEDINEY